MPDERSRKSTSGDPDSPFLFVPHGEAPPAGWLARHPGWMKFPATMVPHRPQDQSTAGARARATMPPHATPVMDTAQPATRAPAIPGAPGAASIAAAAVAAPAEVALAPELVLVLVVVGGLLVWQYLTREQARSLQAPPATPLPPPLPANPGLVPPPMMPDRPADTGLPHPPPIPDLPPRPQADPIPHLIATPASDQAGPTIFHQDRNKGLEGGARTNSKRAREAARRADPEVTQTLQDDEWRAHHLFAVAVARRFPELVAAAARAGWRMDGSSNMTALPASPKTQTKLAEAGIHRPVHDNSHPQWNRQVGKTVEGIVERLEQPGFVKNSVEYDRAARQVLEGAETALRKAVLRLIRVTQNDQAPHTAQT